MPIRPVLFVALLVTLFAFACTLSAVRMQRSHQRTRFGEQQLAAVRADLGEFTSLRLREQVVSTSPRPKQDVMLQVRHTLQDCGLPADRLVSLEPLSDGLTAPARRSEGGLQRGYRRQAFSLSLSEMSPQDLGVFLAEWHRRTLLWTPERISLTHARSSKDANKFDIEIQMAANYIDDSAGVDR